MAATAAIIESSECIVTLAKVLDNILTEKEYTKKTRKLKVSNPTFEKRVVRHVGGIDFLKECGFTQRKDILELTQEAEDKGKLWLARRALHERALLRKVALPALCQNPTGTVISNLTAPIVAPAVPSVEAHTVPPVIAAPVKLVTSTEHIISIALEQTTLEDPKEPKLKIINGPTLVTDQGLSNFQAPLQNNLKTPMNESREPTWKTPVVATSVTSTTLNSVLEPASNTAPPRQYLVPTKTTTNVSPLPPTRSFDSCSVSIGSSMFTDDLDSQVFDALMDEELECLSMDSSASNPALPPLEIVTNQLIHNASFSDNCSIHSEVSTANYYLSTQPNNEDGKNNISSRHCMGSEYGAPPRHVRDESDEWGDALQPPSTTLDSFTGLETPSTYVHKDYNDDVLMQQTETADRADNDARMERERKLEQEMAEALDDYNTSMFRVPPTPETDADVTPTSSNISIMFASPENIPALPPIHSIDDLNAYFDDASSRHEKQTTPSTSSSDLENEMTRLLAEASELRGRTMMRSSSWKAVTEDPSERASSPSLRKAIGDNSIPDDFHYSSRHAHKDWSALDKVMHQASLQNEYESCWGALCTLSVVCAYLSADELALPVKSGTSRSSSKKHSKQTWLPLELVQGLWKLVLTSEKILEPTRIDEVCLNLYDVLVKSNFLEIYERGSEDQDLPHPTWLRVKKEKMVLLGFALPISIEKQTIWMRNLSKAIVEDIQFWYGRYALPTIALAGGDDGAMAKSLLKDLEFVQTRLDVNGLITGTRRHMQDCRAYVKARRDAFRERSEQEQEPSGGTELYYDVALDACQQVATCLYRTGQLLGKARGSEAKRQELCSALHLVGMAAGEWADYDFEIQIYHKAMKLQMENDGTASVASADLLLSMGACNLGLGEFNSAIGCYEEAKRIFEGKLGKKHDKIAQVLHLMGVIHCERSEQTLAMECFKMSLKIRQDNGMVNEYDAAMADTLCWIGRVYREESMPDKAKKYFETARDAREEHFGTDSLEVAEVLHNIAVLYDDAEEFEKSLSYYRKSLKIRRAVLGEEHDDVCELITCIGNVYRSMGDNSTALKAFRRALELRSSVAKSTKLNKSQTEALIYSYEDVLELLSQQVSTSPDPVAVRDEVSSVLLKMGHLHDTISNFDNSVKCFEKALTLRQNSGDGVKAAQALNVIGISFAKRRRFSDAMDSFEKSLALRKEILGEWNNDVAETLHNMGNCAAKKGDLDDAKSYYDESLRIKRKNLGNGNASVAQTLHNLGNIIAEKGAIESAMQHYQEALSIRVDCLGMDHLDVAYSLHCIAKVQKKKHNIKAALEFFNNSLRIKRLNLRKKHPSIAETLEQLGLLNAEIGNEEEALGCLNGALSIFKSKNRMAPKVADIYEALGNMYERNGDECNALNNFSKALRVQSKVFGEDNIKVADMYYKVGMLQKARKSTREALLSFQAATRARKKASGRNDLVIADILCQAGQLQMQLLQVDIAEKCFNEALRIRRQLLEGGDEKIGESLLYVGDVFYACGHYQKAIESALEGYDIFKLNGSGQGMLAAGACQRLGAAYKSCGDLDNSVSFYTRCRALKSALAGNQSLLVAEINHELGAVHFARGDFSKAEELFRDSVEVKVNVLGEDSLEVAPSVLFLGRVCLKMNSPDEATMYFEQARLTKQLHLGDAHLECLEMNQYLAQAHEAKGEFEESLACYNSYLRARRSATGDDEIVSDLLYNVGYVEYQLKRPNDALKSFASALALYRVILGDDNLSVANTLFGLGLVYEAKSEFKESMKYHKEAFRLRRRLLGSDDLSVAETLDRISSLYMKQPNLEKSMQSMKEALRIRSLVLGKDNVEVAKCLFGMGVVFNDLGNTQKAMDCYTVALEIRKEKLGDSSLEVAQTLHNIGSVYAKDRDFANALSFWRKALVSYRDAGCSDDNDLVSVTIGNIKTAEIYQEEQSKLQAAWA